MQKLPKALVVAAAATLATLSLSARAQTPAPDAAAAAAPAAAEPTPPWTLTPKIAIYSEYEYRGIAQSSEEPALQFNLDYAHQSGFYLGTFLSNIKWLKDTADAGGFSTSANMEWDLYGGYRFEIVKDWTLDLGYLRYEYVNSGAFNPKPNTDEVYAGISYGIFSAKYSYSFNNTFAVPDSKGSTYLEVDLNYPLPMLPALTLNGVYGYQWYKGTQSNGFNNDDLSYGVWKGGATYDFGNGFTIGGYVKGTNADKSLYTVEGKYWGKTRLVGFATYSKTF